MVGARKTFNRLPPSRNGAGSFRGRNGYAKKPSNYRPPKTQAQTVPTTSITADEGTYTEQRFENARLQDEIDAQLGFERYQDGPEKLGWLINQHPVG
jgi:DNA polymerase epsilon subunit 1